MLQNILTGFDILGVGIIIGSLALLWAFWKVLHDDLQFEGAALPSPEPETTRSEARAPAPRTTRPHVSAPHALRPARERVGQSVWEPTAMEPVFFHVVEPTTSLTRGAGR